MRNETVPSMGLGPVFAYEWIISSRRWQSYALRSLFVAALLACLFVIVWNRPELTRATSRSDLAQLAEVFYVGLVGTQLTLVLIAAPAATAGAICLDRARGTMTHLLVTDLTDREIVLGKLAARLVPVIGLVGCSLGVMALISLLGGVDPDAMFGAFLVTLSLAVLGCSLALVFSLFAGKTHEALLGTYAVWGLWLLSSHMLRELSGYIGWMLPIPARSCDPYLLAFDPYWRPGTVGWGDYLAFMAVTLGISAVLALVAVIRLRPVCTREKVRKSWIDRLGLRKRLRFVGRLDGTIKNLWSPSLDLNPVLWREWNRSNSSRWVRNVGLLYFGLSAAFSLIAIASQDGGTAAWVNGLQVSIGLVMFSVTSATSLAEERVRGSLDVLMATSLPTRTIVIGKWLGTFRLVPLLMILPVSVIFLTGLKWESFFGAGLMCLYVLLSGAAITGFGLAMATWCSRLGRAVALTVTGYVLICVGWLFAALMVRNHGPTSDGLLMASPFYWAGQFTWDTCNSNGMRSEHISWAIFWMNASGMAAIIFPALTLLTFNRCLGRVESGLLELNPAQYNYAKLERVKNEVLEITEVV